MDIFLAIHLTCGPGCLSTSSLEPGFSRLQDSFLNRGQPCRGVFNWTSRQAFDRIGRTETCK